MQCRQVNNLNADDADVNNADLRRFIFSYPFYSVEPECTISVTY